MSDSHQKRALLFIAGLFGFRLLVQLLWPVGMMGDETYYWTWGRDLALGYYSKPPMIGWIYGLVGRGFGDHVLVFKATSLVLSSLCLVALFFAIRRLAGAETALWTVLIFGLSAGHLALSLILTTDVPLLLFWCLALWAIATLLDEEDRPPGHAYLILWASLGLGMLSKQMILALIPMLFILFAIYRRPLLKDWRLYAACVFSLLFLIPPIIWNSQHDWVTFEHTGHHFETSPPTFMDFLRRTGEAVGGILLLIGPVIIVALVRALKAQATRSREVWRRPLGALFLLGPLGLLAMLTLLLRQKVNPNWPAAFLMVSCAYTAHVLLAKGRAGRLWLRTALAVNALLSLVLIAAVAGDWFAIGSQKRAFLLWPELAHRTSETRVHRELEDLPILAVGHRYLASQLEFHMRGQPRVRHWPPTKGKVRSQYDLQEAPPPGTDFFVVSMEKKLPPDIEESFEKVEFLGEATESNSSKTRTFRYYRASGLIQWKETRSKRKLR